MRAVQVREFGGPDVLEPVELPEPVPGPGQLLLAMAAADVIYLDTMRRAGHVPAFASRLPYVPGRGGAGRVVAVGEGVDPAWVGRRVVARTDGGYAERLLATEAEVVAVPDGLDLREAAAVLHDGGTAIGLVDGAAPVPRDGWVLVTAAAGGAGHLVVQLARDAGARVIAAARGERKLAMLRELGAAAVVDYSLEGWQDRVRETTGGRGADLVFDGAGGGYGRAAFDAVAEGGRFVTYGTTNGGPLTIDEALAARRGVTVHYPLKAGPPDPATARDRIARALELAAKGVLRPYVGATYPLERAAEAHRALEERRTVGRALLIIGD